MGPVKLLGRAASTAIHTMRHPIASTAYAAGMARGLAGAVLHGATVTGHDPEAGPRPVPTQRDSAEPPATAGPPEPQRVPKPVPDPADLPEPVVIEAADEQPGEQFATEPKPVSRDSGHGGTDAVDAEVDAWDDEAGTWTDTGPDVETPVGTTGADVGHNPDTAEADLQQPGTAPLLDPSVAKEVRSESEIMRKAAETDPE